MVAIIVARDEDVQGFIECYSKVWRSFRGILPEQWVEEVIREAGQPSFRENIQSAIADPDRILLVAEGDGEILGLAQGRVNRGGYSWLGFMGVSPGHRRQGIGRELVEKFIEVSRSCGCTKVSLNTAPCLKPAIKLYADMGFIPEGYMRDHMHGLDLIYYSLFLE
ncbi:MAG: GNAT family N-acetyltransferase [Candidatus Bathyarchaeota archaeon]